ncbi:pseudaminic acid synthase [Pedobacter sp. B4-66]|uniref:pseudaminic acid synthase n=1 Tax=Pedobacter sp. B4-66 TaxID=2817280 RepID=UPI001BD94B09|nr:pseudaminic acid synthase [Pedobacter sp. B4-66]
MKIGNHEIGAGRTYIIAELSANHNQSLETAIRTIEAAAVAGADAIKLQTYTADTITIDCKTKDFSTKEDGPWAGQTLHELYKKAYTPWEWHAELQAIAERNGLGFFSSPFDPTAVEFLEELNVPAYKIASFEITDIPLIELVASKRKPIIISTGIASEEDIELALDACKRMGNDEIILLKCTSSYPAPIEEANMVMVKDMAEKYGVITGLSDHTIGSTVPIVSVCFGAKVIEKHFILDRSVGGPDASFSMNVQEFTEMVKAVREAEKAIGVINYTLTEKQLSSRSSSRSLYVVKDIKCGEVITAENVRSIRPGFGLHPKYYKEILGKKVNKDLSKGTRLSFELIDGLN